MGKLFGITETAALATHPPLAHHSAALHATERALGSRQHVGRRTPPLLRPEQVKQAEQKQQGALPRIEHQDKRETTASNQRPGVYLHCDPCTAGKRYQTRSQCVFQAQSGSRCSRGRFPADAGKSPPLPQLANRAVSLPRGTSAQLRKSSHISLVYEGTWWLRRASPAPSRWSWTPRSWVRGLKRSRNRDTHDFTLVSTGRLVLTFPSSS